MLRIPEEVLERAFEHLRSCGEGQAECVVYLTGPVDHAGLVDGVTHPPHTAGPGWYQLDSAALGSLWVDLADSERSIRLQIHTHPGAAYHSSLDDTLAIVHTPGFYSLVVPRYAQGDVGLDGAFLAMRRKDGAWTAVSIADHLEVFS